MKQWLRRLAPGGLLMGALGCSPALDWREMRPDGTQVAVAMPCRPSDQRREVPLVGQRVAMRLFSCNVQGATFGLAHVRLPDATQAGAALLALGESARANVRGSADAGEQAQVPGMTPLPQARHWRWVGVRPDGQSVTAWVTVFAYGPNVYQATVVGAAVDEALVQHFRSALAVRPVGSA